LFLLFYNNRQKTAKSTAELEVELNATYAFDAITEAGAHLTPVSGPGLQGLQNLGNSCYMNSVLQMLFSLEELARRYGTKPGAMLQHELLQQVSTTAAPTDLLCQTIKVASALTSGVFCRPLDNDDTDTNENDPKYRLAPRMFKHVIGKDHVDFCTGQQQDAAQFLQYFLERLDRAELGTKMKGHVSSNLFSFQTTQRLVCSADSRVKYKAGAPETMWSLRIPMDKATVLADAAAMSDDEKDVTATASPDQKRLKAEKPVPSIALTTCIEEWATETMVQDLRWPHLQNATHTATQLQRFQTFPRYLLVHMQRYQLGPDWQPVKLEVNLQVEQELDLTAFRSTGPQEGENLVPEDPPEAEIATAAVVKPVLDEMALTQLMDMGFSLNSCKRALTSVGGSNVEAAMGWVFEHNTDPDFNDPLPEDDSGGNSGVDEGVVQSLVASLGCFSADQVRAALVETNGAPDRAADWLFSHMDDLDTAIAALKDNKTAAVPSSPQMISLEDGTGKYSLMGMISHIGKHTGSGHYVAHLKKDGKWVIFNDEKVALSSEPPFQHAYIYLYQRTDTIGSPNVDY
jgi:ubiquitin carboxyl-terminal hydrolase 5/13